jgi:hypothetical protein
MQLLMAVPPAEALSEPVGQLVHVVAALVEL